MKFVYYNYCKILQNVVLLRHNKESENSTYQDYNVYLDNSIAIIELEEIENVMDKVIDDYSELKMKEALKNRNKGV